MKAILLTIVALLTGCTHTSVQTTVTVVKVGVDVDKENSPEYRNRGGDLGVIPDILKAVPEGNVEGAVDEYFKGTGSGQ